MRMARRPKPLRQDGDGAREVNLWLTGASRRPREIRTIPQPDECDGASKKAICPIEAAWPAPIESQRRHDEISAIHGYESYRYGYGPPRGRRNAPGGERISTKF